jgi:uncharacterized protein (TIGR02646 family)
MRYISDNQPPEELILWLREQRKENLNLRYDDLTPVKINGVNKDVRQSIIDQRLKDQGYLCAYTMLRIHEDSCHVEHIYPRSCSYAKGYPEKSVEYANMIACYPLQKSGDKRGKCPFGAEARGNEPLGLHPLDPTCEQRLRYKSNGEVVATNPSDNNAINIIDAAGKLLRLNHPKLVKWRKSAIDQAGIGIPTTKALRASKRLTEAQATRLKNEVLQFQRGQKLRPHCVAIAHAADEHIERIRKRRMIRQQLMKRSKQDNLNFYAFTATPKFKTKHVFDEPGPDGNSPYHLYSMRQAIEEKFILDVLKNYTTYETYYRIVQATENDKHVERKKAARSLARILTLHPHNLTSKTEVMIEHFRTHVKHKIGGRAKAMVVTDSRLHAVRYKQAFDKYIKEKGYKDIKTLVAFSGTVEDPDEKGKHWTEVGMNQGIKESELPEKFDSPDYQVLLVAEKYQTGFDQPLLHTMYVDKKLTGLKAVQTLSRLNRTCAGKEDTFILDFRNSPEEIFKAFKPYYEDTPSDPITDSQHLYRLQHQIEELGLIFEEEINEFCAIYFQPKRKETKLDHAQMNGVLDKAVERFKELDEDDCEEAKALLVNFRNMYSFLSQVIPYQDSDLEKLYTYLRFLLTKLPRRQGEGPQHLEDEIELQYYRLQKISEGQIDLNTGDGKPLKGPSDVGTGKEDEVIALSELIDILNERFGTEFTQADQLFFDQIQEEAFEDEKLKQAARTNNKDDFRYVFEKAFEGLVIDRMEGNDEISEKLLSDGDFRDLAIEHLLHKVYKQLKDGKSA